MNTFDGIIGIEVMFMLAGLNQFLTPPLLWENLPVVDVVDAS